MPRANLPPPRLVAWETTRACDLACRHCRAEARPGPAPGELDAKEGAELLRQISLWDPPPMVILSGGEPLKRPDILELASLGTSLGLRMLLSTNGTALDPSLVRALKKAGIKRLSLSLDGHDAASHDAFRGVRGAFASLKRSARLLVEGDLPFQINSTVTAGNLKDLVAIQDLAFSLGAVAHHIFLLVPVGRAKDWDEAPLEPQDYENALLLLKDREISLQLEIKATCAPQYQRISREKGQVSARSGRGCLGGQGFLFISHDGIAQACGYLPLPAGNVRAEPLREIYQNSPLFGDLRDRARYRGKCGLCEYFKVCGGCRARAHAQGDCLGPEPLCPHLPQALRRSPDVAP